MRVGELGGLRDDAMYRLGDTWWLRIPVGKLHNDRTVPLHPMLVGLINDYRAWRGPTATGLLVERDDHQPMDSRTIYRHVTAVARRAGVGHVHPHALRHTLATQCKPAGVASGASFGRGARWRCYKDLGRSACCLIGGDRVACAGVVPAQGDHPPGLLHSLQRCGIGSSGDPGSGEP